MSNTLDVHAIFALLAIDARAPIVPNEDAEQAVIAAALADYSRDGSVLELTDRGRAFLRMLEATPLPVRVERWDDPREQSNANNANKSANIDANMMASTMASMFAMFAKAGAAPLPAAMTPLPGQPGHVSAARTPAPTVVTSIPPGFTPVKPEWANMPDGQWPAELPHDAEITTLWRDGRVRKVSAVQAVRWRHIDNFDDVLAYRLTGDPTDSVVVVS